MPNTSDQAIAHCASQAGTPFGVGLCKQRCRIAYAVPSDGSRSAAEAWTRTKQRLNVSGANAPRGALVWWTGGSGGYGHVAIADGKGGVWSTDILRDGYWGHVPFADIERTWPNLTFVGVSRDIDGVTVVPAPVAPEKPIAAPAPSILDLTIALERFAAQSSNPRAVVSYTLARRILGSLVDSGARVKVPTTVRGVVSALESRREVASGVTKARLTAALALLRPLV